jgi:hypothetical protein
MAGILHPEKSVRNNEDSNGRRRRRLSTDQRWALPRIEALAREARKPYRQKAWQKSHTCLRRLCLAQNPGSRDCLHRRFVNEDVVTADESHAERRDFAQGVFLPLNWCSPKHFFVPCCQASIRSSAPPHPDMGEAGALQPSSNPQPRRLASAVLASGFTGLDSLGLRLVPLPPAGLLMCP